MFEKIMVGIDRETGGRDAIALARELAVETSRLTLTHVHGGFPIPAKGSNFEFEAEEQDRAVTFLHEIATENGIDATVRAIGASSVGRGLHRLPEAEAAGQHGSATRPDLPHAAPDPHARRACPAGRRRAPRGGAGADRPAPDGRP